MYAYIYIHIYTYIYTYIYLYTRFVPPQAQGPRLRRWAPRPRAVPAYAPTFTYFTSMTCPDTSTTASWHNMTMTHSSSTVALPMTYSLISTTENTLRQIRTYFLRNGLKLNSNKTQCIFFATHQLLTQLPNISTIRCADSDIQPSTQAKNLGIYLDSYMMFDRHINETIKKAMGTLMYTDRNKDHLHKETRITILQTLVLSTIKYGITIWGTTNSTLLNKVQKVHSFARKTKEIWSCFTNI